jgi:hypothetical protein
MFEFITFLSSYLHQKGRTILCQFPKGGRGELVDLKITGQ